MPNHITNRIILDTKDALVIFPLISPDDTFDFNLLIPTPFHIYQADDNALDQEDFKHCSWAEWNQINWGTKWNSYNVKKGDFVNGKSYLQFQTASSVPFPVIIAFANRFNIPFEHRYIEGYLQFWSIEKWSNIDQYSKKAGSMKRISVERNKVEHKRLLSIELMGFDCDELGDDE